MRLMVTGLCWLVFSPLFAVDYYRCVNADGSIVFSQKSCGPDAAAGVIEHQPTGNSTAGSSPSAIEQLENYRRDVNKINRLIGSKEKTPKPETDHCDQVTALSLRNARVRKEIMKCHSEDDIQHIHGTADSVSEWSDRKAYDTRWTYRSREEGTLYIYFKQGKVTRWSRHGKKP